MCDRESFAKIRNGVATADEIAAFLKQAIDN